MKIEKIWLKETENKLYIEKDGKIYKTNASPYRKIKEEELEEIKTPLPKEIYIKANHLYEPTKSYEYDLKTYGLEK